VTPIVRVFAHHDEWEDAQAGMYKLGVPRDGNVQLSAGLLRDTVRLTETSFRVLSDWPISSAVNLSNSSMNHQAWMGHAACAMLFGSTEDESIAAWHLLTPEEQVAANAAVDIANDRWRREFDAEEFAQCPNAQLVLMF
jgi:hypothetical protein